MLKLIYLKQYKLICVLIYGMISFYHFIFYQDKLIT